MGHFVTKFVYMWEWAAKGRIWCSCAKDAGGRKLGERGLAPGFRIPPMCRGKGTRSMGSGLEITSGALIQVLSMGLH